MELEPTADEARRLVITLTAIIDPRWWHRTAIPPTGWPRPAVEAVLLLTLASGLVAIGLGFAQAG
ncbi:MAG: hypothetical protein JWN67_2457 [Actinomycetia bacterium]|nr:hypothetical protein [Actinomycetes bacterium]